jgi:Protein of unknown function (DUF4239)
MNSVLAAALVFGFALAGAFLGMRTRVALPDHHLSSDSKAVVQLCMGLIATLTALVLGLVTASAKDSFDAQGSAVRNMAASVVLLDRTLVEYGPETASIRAEMRVVLADRIAAIWTDAPPPPGASPTTAPAGKSAFEIQKEILALAPKNDVQRWAQSEALSTAADTLKTRLVSLTQQTSSVPTPFLLVITLWLAVLFWSFGLFAPRNGTVFAVLVLTAASVSACVLLILEMQTPFTGFMQVSREPLLYALRNLDGD